MRIQLNQDSVNQHLKAYAIRNRLHRSACFALQLSLYMVIGLICLSAWRIYGQNLPMPEGSHFLFGCLAALMIAAAALSIVFSAFSMSDTEGLTHLLKTIYHREPAADTSATQASAETPSDIEPSRGQTDV